MENINYSIILPQRANETTSAYNRRKIIFLKIYKKSNDVDLAIKFSNIWANH